MKILQINVFNYRRGGAETVYLNTSQYLRDLGHDVINFTLKWEENYPSKYEKYFPESKGTRKGIFRQINNAFNYFYHIEAAKKRKEPLDHVLLYGPPGLGKTTLASIISNEMNSNIKITSGPAIEKPGEMAAILNNLQEYKAPTFGT